MSIAARVAAMLEGLSDSDINVLSPAERRRLADRCRYVAGIADLPSPQSGYSHSEAPKAGVLSALRGGHRWE